jgi:hypothetical protein
MPSATGSVLRELIANQRAPVSEIWAQPTHFESEEFKAAERQGELRRLSRHSCCTFWSRLGGSGTSDMIWLGDGHAVNVANCVRLERTSQRYATDEPLIILRASLACDLSY